MTVTYTYDVSNSNASCFIKTIFRWKGSLWKSIAIELICWCLLYLLITLIYRLALNDFQKDIFEKLCTYFQQYGGLLPVTYMLGYFVTHVVGRWNEMLFKAVGWIDNIGLLIVSYINGTSKRADLYRRTMIRYLIVIQIMAFRIVSPAMKRRFPDLDDLITEGFITKEERQHLEDAKFYMACTWVCRMLEDAKMENLISSRNAIQQLMIYALDFRKSSLTCVLYDYFSLPVAYVQVIYLCVRIFLIVSLLGRQIIDTEKYPSRAPIDPYVPFMTIIQFVFLVGWCKVAEALLNPWGEDDDDFEVNFIVNRNLRVGNTIVADEPTKCPPLVKDFFWDDSDAEPLYSLETATEPQNPCLGSAASPEPETEIEPPVTMVKRRASTASYLENLTSKLKQRSKKSSLRDIITVTEENECTPESKSPTKKGRKYSLPVSAMLDKSIAGGMPNRETRTSCPSLNTLDEETIAEVALPEKALPTSVMKRDNLDSSKRVRWRPNTGDNNSSKTIDDVKLALRKCSSNFTEPHLEDEDSAIERDANDDSDSSDDNQSKPQFGLTFKNRGDKDDALSER